MKQTQVRLLLIEPDLAFQSYLSTIIAPHYSQVTCCQKASQAKRLLKTNGFDLLLCELSLLDTDGPQFFKWLGIKYPLLPLIAISSRQMPRDRVIALQAGADVFLAKPLLAEEVLAYINALLRRTENFKQQIEQAKITSHGSEGLIQIAGLKLTSENSQAWLNEQNLNLTQSEFELLYLLASHPDRALSRQRLMHTLWPTKSSTSRILDTYVLRLRQRLSEFKPPESNIQLVTLHGKGYCLSTQSESPLV